MGVYRLDPIKPLDPSWGVSTVSEVVWAEAGTSKDARTLVSNRTMTLRPGVSPLLVSPWVDERITACVLEPTRTDIPEGIVVDAKGRDVFALYGADTIAGAFQIFAAASEASAKADAAKLKAITARVAAEIGKAPIFINDKGEVFVDSKLNKLLDEPGNESLREMLIMGARSHRRA